MYYVIFGVIYLFSLLPIRLLYLFGDVVYFFLYPVFGYRRRIVLGNLAIAFPEKSEAERRVIAKKFYRNFVDHFIETLKLMSASRRFIEKRFTGDWSVFQRLYNEGSRCQVHLGHNFNWEMAAVAMPFYLPYQYFLVVYMPVGNRNFERLFLRLRGRTGTYMLPATNMRNQMMAFRDKQYCLALVADQVPGDAKNAYWLYFFGKPTPFVFGPEKGAKAGKIPVLFAHFTKVKRGYYRVHVNAIENSDSLPDGELTRRYIRYLEKTIRESPDMWLWSHRRWKRQWKDEYRSLWIDERPAPGAPKHSDVS